MHAKSLNILNASINLKEALRDFRILSEINKSKRIKTSSVQFFLRCENLNLQKACSQKKTARENNHFTKQMFAHLPALVCIPICYSAIAIWLIIFRCSSFIRIYFSHMLTRTIKSKQQTKRRTLLFRAHNTFFISQKFSECRHNTITIKLSLMLFVFHSLQFGCRGMFCFLSFIR